MTWKRYKRLLLVVAGPLLLAGALTSYWNLRSAHYVGVFCQVGELLGENCRWAFSESRFHNYLEKLDNTWFDVKIKPFEQNRFPYVTVSRSQLLIRAKIIDAKPYLGTDDGRGSFIEQLRSAKGKNALISFRGGIPTEQKISTIHWLECGELNLVDFPLASYAGMCVVPGGLAEVKISLDAEGLDYISTFKSTISSEIADARKTLIIRYLIGVPIFLVLFGFLSALAWLAKRAVAFVRAV